jgi:hypothetical protein
MNEISQPDKERLKLMIKQLIMFENKIIDLSFLVTRLESLLQSMDHVPEKWEDTFLNEFEILESINAKTPDMKISEIEELIQNAVGNLKNLMDEKMFF